MENTHDVAEMRALFGLYLLGCDLVVPRYCGAMADPVGPGKLAEPPLGLRHSD